MNENEVVLTNVELISEALIGTIIDASRAFRRQDKDLIEKEGLIHKNQLFSLTARTICANNGTRIIDDQIFMSVLITMLVDFTYPSQITDTTQKDSYTCSCIEHPEALDVILNIPKLSHENPCGDFEFHIDRNRVDNFSENLLTAARLFIRERGQNNG